MNQNNKTKEELIEEIKLLQKRIDEFQAADTERKLAEKEILALSKFPSQNPNPVLCIAKDGTVLYSNKGGLKLLAGWKVGVGEKAPQRWCRLIKEKFDSETIGLEEGCEDKPFSITIVPVKESGYVNLYGLDVTERFKVENELRMAYEKLKKSQAQLVQSGKMSAIGQLSSGVAHELNNPLTGILSGAQILKVSFDDPKAFKLEDFKELIDIMEESALRCKKIVRSLLDFSHAGLSELRPLSLNDLADRVVNLVEYDMRLRDVYIRRQFSADLPSITGDSALLQQVIFNMVSNAGWAIEQKQNRSEKGIIVLDTKYLKESKTVCLTISDNGIGVKFENMSRLFEPFFTTKPVGQGPGLSLSVCYSIIKEHGGSIEAASVEGKGTDFRITLPT